jgi:hypothetical protein
LPPVSMGSGCGSGISSSSSSSSNSSNNKGGLTIALWAQIEQSGLLQQLPGMLNSHLQTLQSNEPHAGESTREIFIDMINLCTLLSSLRKLNPIYLSAHAAGQQCLVPAMQLALSSLPYISIALAHEGQRAWMQQWLGSCWQLAILAGFAATPLLKLWCLSRRAAGPCSGAA